MTFVHVVTERENGGRSLNDVEAFTRFRERIGERCDEPPVASGLQEIGAYRQAG